MPPFTALCAMKRRQMFSLGDLFAPLLPSDCSLRPRPRASTSAVSQNVQTEKDPREACEESKRDVSETRLDCLRRCKSVCATVISIKLGLSLLRSGKDGRENTRDGGSTSSNAPRFAAACMPICTLPSLTLRGVK